MGRLSIEETLLIALPLLSAIEHAHGLGIVHRDLKPDNVFLAVEPDGQMMPKIVDFGISKDVRESPITLNGQTVGTPSYMSPEQTMGDPVDARSDVFAMGLLVYECLSGRNPFVIEATGEGARPNFIAVFDVEPAPLASVSPEFGQVIARALAKQPGDRFASASEFAKALQAAAPARTPPSDPRSSTQPEISLGAVAAPVRASSKRSWLTAAAVTAALVGAIPLASARFAATPETTNAARVASNQDLPARQKHLTARVDRLDDASAAEPRSGPERRRLATTGTARLVRDPGF
jgi:serine/threonine-protein kinase